MKLINISLYPTLGKGRANKQGAMPSFLCGATPPGAAQTPPQPDEWSGGNQLNFEEIKLSLVKNLTSQNPRLPTMANLEVFLQEHMDQGRLTLDQYVHLLEEGGKLIKIANDFNKPVEVVRGLRSRPTSNRPEAAGSIPQTPGLSKGAQIIPFEDKTFPDIEGGVLPCRLDHSRVDEVAESVLSAAAKFSKGTERQINVPPVKIGLSIVEMDSLIRRLDTVLQKRRRYSQVLGEYLKSLQQHTKVVRSDFNQKSLIPLKDLEISESGKPKELDKGS